MYDLELTQKTALGRDEPVAEAWEGFVVSEIMGNRFLWIAVRPDGEEKLARYFRKTVGADLPGEGKFTTGKGMGEVIVASVAPGQWVMRCAAGQDLAEIEKFAYVTDQTDGWVGMSVTGEETRPVLAKLCPLDLHETAFPSGSSARTPFEGMHCHITCRDASQGRFDLYLQRSSARSFLDHMRDAAYGTCGERIDPTD